MLGAFRVIAMEWMPILGETAMGRHSWLQKLYWSRFGKPAEERELIKFLIGQPISSVLEIGIGNAARMRRLAKLVTLNEDCEQLRYIGVDEFESATGSRPHLSLKQTHQLAKQLGFRASLVPGDHQSAVVRVANKMMACDLVIVDGGLDPQTPSAGPIGAWLHRLAHADSTVFASHQSGGQLVPVDCRDFDLPQRRAA